MLRPAVVVLVALLAGCGDDPSQLSDAGTTDAGDVRDAGPADAGDESDAGTADAGDESDAGTPDAGDESDAGTTCDGFLEGGSCLPFTTCPPGTYVSTAGTPTSDRACDACPLGTFSTADNVVACTAHKPCDVVETAGTPTSDQECAVDCVIAWEEWSCCKPAQEGPRQTRTGTITTPASTQGACPASLAEQRTCASDAPVCCEASTSSSSCVHPECEWVSETGTCRLKPFDCVYSAWSAWSTCSRSCSGGTQTRTRTIVSEARNGGRPCDGPLEVTQPCNSGITCACSVFPDESTCGSYADARCKWSDGACVDDVQSCEAITSEAECQTSSLCCEWVFESCVPATCGG